MSAAVVTTPIAEVKALVDTLADLDITPLHLHVDGRAALDGVPDMKLWLTTRTDFEAVCSRLGAKKVSERRFSPPGQREFVAEVDTATRRLLVQCVSFEHHEDWLPREVSS